MPELADEFRVSVAMILGMIAVLATLLVWRERDIPQTAQQIRLLYLYRRTGLAPVQIDRSLTRLLWGSSFFIIGFFLCAVFFYYSFHYFSVIRLLISKSGSLDLGVFDRLRSHADVIRNETVTMGTVAILTLLLDWIMSVVFRTQHFAIGIDAVPRDSHAFVVSRDWEEAPAALWEHRISLMAEWYNKCQSKNDFLDESSTTLWRQDWVSWARCVSSYQSFVRLQPDSNSSTDFREHLSEQSHHQVLPPVLSLPDGNEFEHTTSSVIPQTTKSSKSAPLRNDGFGTLSLLLLGVIALKSLIQEFRKRLN
jgi:hypothetical protein